MKQLEINLLQFSYCHFSYFVPFAVCARKGFKNERS